MDAGAIGINLGNLRVEVEEHPAPPAGADLAPDPKTTLPGVLAPCRLLFPSLLSSSPLPLPPGAKISQFAI